MHGRVRAAASLCVVLAAQARKLSLSASLGWAEEAQKTPRTEQRRQCSYNQSLQVLYPCVFGRFACLSWHLADRAGGQFGLATAMFFFEAPPPGYAVLWSVGVSAAGATIAIRRGSRFIASLVVVDKAQTADGMLGGVGPV